MNREELIEKAAGAGARILYEAEPRGNLMHDRDWDAAGRATRDIFMSRTRPIVTTALAVFEEGSTPTDDEREALIAELRWLAEARKEYETDVFPSIAREVQTARHLADILERKTPVTEGGHGFGWIPSWRWDEWDQMTSRTVQGEGGEPLRLPALIANRTINRAIGDDQVRGWNSTVAIMQAHELIVTAIEFDRSERFRTGEPTPVRIQGRRGGKTQAMIESLLAQANDRGIRVEVVYPQGEPSDAAVDGSTSDGYHTFDELYDYRMLYHAHAAQGWLAQGVPVVKSWRHSDGEPCFGGGWFIVSAAHPAGQITNHYKAEHWGLFDVPEVETPPEYDGHTPQDVAHRLRAALRAATAVQGGETR